MRVLITGHKGFIGVLMARLLQETGHEVVGLDSGFFADCVFGVDGKPIPEIQEDLRTIDAKQLAGFDAVVHLAGLSNDPLGNINPDLTYDINHRASVHLAQLAKQAGVRQFIFSSSCSLYGKVGDDPLDEEGPQNPLTAYAVSKARTEEDIRPLADDSFCPTYMRNATAYGASPRLRLDLVLNSLVASAHATGKVLIQSDGTPWRPIVHIRDITAAFIAVLDAPWEAVHNQAFNVGANSENYQVSQLAEIVRDVMPGVDIEYAAGGGPDARSYQVNFDKIGRVLPGFKPQWNARRGAEELRDVYQKVGLTKEDIEGRMYNRLAQLKYLLDQGQIDQNLYWMSGVRA